MKKIYNPYTEISDYHCFGCAPSNPFGLQMEFHEDGEEIVSFWKPLLHFQGYGNILHGGIIASLLDEISSWAVFIKLKTSGVTRKIEISYIKPVVIKDEPLKLTSSIVSTEKNIALIHSRLFSGDSLSSEAKAEFFSSRRKLQKKSFFSRSMKSFSCLRKTEALQTPVQALPVFPGISFSSLTAASALSLLWSESDTCINGNTMPSSSNRFFISSIREFFKASISVLSNHTRKVISCAD